MAGKAGDEFQIRFSTVKRVYLRTPILIYSIGNSRATRTGIGFRIANQMILLGNASLNRYYDILTSVLHTFV